MIDCRKLHVHGIVNNTTLRLIIYSEHQHDLDLYLQKRANVYQTKRHIMDYEFNDFELATVRNLGHYVSYYYQQPV